MRSFVSLCGARLSWGGRPGTQSFLKNCESFLPDLSWSFARKGLGKGSQAWEGCAAPSGGLPESRWPQHASSLLLSLLSASLVPVYSFGENDVFHLKAFAPGSWQYLCQVAFKKLTGYSPCIFWGRGLFSANSWGLLPFARPITTVVGRPIPVPQILCPTQEEVNHYHTLYMQALETLFEEHKESCGVPASTHLTFI
uniref:2-acylglycerol O-acyltransferase 3 n=1 Tax=Panthera onca TaxID=9690 RepID=UPI0029532988|nr:2-acylglycerol O-acyltransferase 3 [Panthera onca]